MKETKKDLNELNEEDLQDTSGGKGRTFDEIIPNIRKIHTGPKDIFPGNRIEEILKNYNKNK